MIANINTGLSMKTRPIEREQDWWRIRGLLIETHGISGPGFNWEIRHWDGNRFHREGPTWNTEIYHDFCLWETQQGRLAGVAHKEGDDELWMQIHPDFRTQIEPEMLAWGEQHAAGTNAEGRRQVQMCVYEYDGPRIRLLEKAGYEKMTYGWITRWMRMNRQVLPQPVIAQGYEMRATFDEGDPQVEGEHWQDCQHMADLLNAAFNRPGFHQAVEYHNFMTCSPGFRNELNLVAAAPDGSFAAHAALNYDEANRYAVFEPVCTHPDHRRKGLAQALMFEGLHRVREMGATHVEVSTGDADAANGLYDSIGFGEYYKAYYWKKIL